MSARALLLAGAAAMAVAIGLGVALVRHTGPAGTATTAAAADSLDAVQHALRAGKPTVVEFGANACAACREMKPRLAQIAREHGDRFGVLDVDVLKDREALRRHRIVVLPTLVFFDAAGRETGRHAGPLGVAEMLEQLQRAAPGSAP